MPRRKPAQPGGVGRHAARGQGAQPPSKVSLLRAAMRRGDWRTALNMASKFGELGAQRDAILSGHEAYVRPEFYRQLGRDIEAMKEAGRLALIEKYGE